MNIEGKTITIIGFAKSGMAVAELIHRHQGKIKISEAKPARSFESLWDGWLLKSEVAAEFGGHTERFIEGSDLVVLSPGVRIDAPPVQWALSKKIPVMGEIELAWRFCGKPVVAVTGSNGKTTVSTLIARVLEKNGMKVALCGNIGSPFSRHVLDLDGKDIVVLEVSSFQLESIVDFRPYVAVWTNFSQNHLDRHKDLQEYFEAKKKIFLNQKNDDYAVLNYEDTRIKALAPKLNAIISFFNPPGIQARAGFVNPNFLAALEVGRIFGVSLEQCREVFADFKGVEHRLETVRVLKGVRFINDSKATTVEAARWALTSIDGPIIMICGGRDKKIDFSVLRDLVKSKVKKMVVIGEAKEKLKSAFQDVVAIEEGDTLEHAVRLAQKSASKGDNVILSPMCTSFDMFADFEDRGRIFKEIVSRLS